MENYQCHITIHNRAPKRLKLVKTDLSWGVFREGPVDEILPKLERKAFVATGAPNLPSGTEGTVIYKIGDDANVTVSIYFDIPTKPFSSNTVKVTTTHPDVVGEVQGLSSTGSTESCIIKIVDGR